MFTTIYDLLNAVTAEYGATAENCAALKIAGSIKVLRPDENWVTSLKLMATIDEKAKIQRLLIILGWQKEGKEVATEAMLALSAYPAYLPFLGLFCRPTAETLPDEDKHFIFIRATLLIKSFSTNDMMQGLAILENIGSWTSCYMLAVFYDELHSKKFPYRTSDMLFELPSNSKICYSRRTACHYYQKSYVAAPPFIKPYLLANLLRFKVPDSLHLCVSIEWHPSLHRFAKIDVRDNIKTLMLLASRKKMGLSQLPKSLLLGKIAPFVADTSRFTPTADFERIGQLERLVWKHELFFREIQTHPEQAVEPSKKRARHE
ncbi:MAG: hypothetical protein ACMG6E_05565 [Candidatus Roizmanbacteria bacterium]